MRIVVLGFIIIFMSCASSKNTLSLDEIAKFKSVIKKRNIEINSV